MRMPDLDLRNLLVENSPWRYAHLHRRNFNRFIGDRLNAAVNSSCDIVRISCASVLASLPAITSRGANACPFSSCANLMLYGQTSWENCRYTHFEIPLATGRRTLRKARR
jgi:hypothetical protein